MGKYGWDPTIKASWTPILHLLSDNCYQVWLKSSLNRTFGGVVILSRTYLMFPGPSSVVTITNWLALGRQHFRRWMPVALFQRCVVSGKRWGSCRGDCGVNHLDLSVFGFGVGHGWLWIFGSLNPLVNRHFPHEMPMTWGNGNFFSTLP